ncbi:hypothetical protein T09_9148 [Trichinella sp. T9]|nr:hypothetical protein T09_9148 [Trichinella sp. T9]
MSFIRCRKPKFLLVVIVMRAIFGVTRPGGVTRKSRVGKNNTRAPPARSLSEHLAVPSRGQKGFLLRPDLSTFARQLRARHEGGSGQTKGHGSANSPAASELLIGGPNEPPAWAAEPSSIYRATNERRDYYYSEKLSQLVEPTAVE